MKVYVIEEFTRNDEFCEYDSGIVAVLFNEEAAIKRARDHAYKNVETYGYIREDVPENNLKYYCCLDSDPSNEAEYANYMTITVTEHEVEEN